MKKLATLLASICLIIATTSCSQSGNLHASSWGNAKKVVGSSNYVTKEIKVDNFQKLAVLGSIDVIFTQKAGAPKVEIYTSDNLVDLVEIEVEDNQLQAGLKKGYNISYKKLEVRIWAEVLDYVSLTGSGDVILKNGINTEGDLSINLAGSGDIEGRNINCKQLTTNLAGSGDIEIENIICNTLKASVAGSGDVELKGIESTHTQTNVAGSGTVVLSGKCQSATYKVAGSGDLFADKYKAEQVNATVAGSGSIRCFASQKLKTSISGSGDIGYKGNPTEMQGSKKNLYKL